MRALIQDYQNITSEIIKLEERINSIYTAAASAKIRIITDMPMAPGFSEGGLENTFIRIEELEERIAKYREERERVAAQIEGPLDLAGISPLERIVFWYREIHEKKWREIAEITGKSVRHLQRISQNPIYMSLLL